MFKIGPKCAHVRKENETSAPGVCPACGLIFAKYVEATQRSAAKRDAASSATDKPPGKNVVIICLLLIVMTAFGYWYKNTHARRHTGQFKSVVLPLAKSGAGGVQQREFSELFANDTPLSSLADAGHYTVVEVYLDQCAYCRELEAALTPLRDKRPDVTLIRVHHPGQMSLNVHGNSREEVQRQMDQLNVKMKSYSLCGSPHVEVYGPDRQALAIDGCGERAGTALLWNWIGTETGVTRRSAAGAVTGM
jgi:hypothetical protein